MAARHAARGQATDRSCSELTPPKTSATRVRRSRTRCGASRRRQGRWIGALGTCGVVAAADRTDVRNAPRRARSPRIRRADRDRGHDPHVGARDRDGATRPSRSARSTAGPRQRIVRARDETGARCGFLPGITSCAPHCPHRDHEGTAGLQRQAVPRRDGRSSATCRDRWCGGPPGRSARTRQRRRPLRGRGTSRARDVSRSTGIWPAAAMRAADHRPNRRWQTVLDSSSRARGQRPCQTTYWAITGGSKFEMWFDTTMTPPVLGRSRHGPSPAWCAAASSRRPWRSAGRRHRAGLATRGCSEARSRPRSGKEPSTPTWSGERRLVTLRS